VDVYRAILENLDGLGPILLSVAYRQGQAGVAWAQANATTASRKSDSHSDFLSVSFSLTFQTTSVRAPSPCVLWVDSLLGLLPAGERWADDLPFLPAMARDGGPPPRFSFPIYFFRPKTLPGAPFPKDLKRLMKRIARDPDSHDFTYFELENRVEVILRPLRVYLAQQTLEHAFTLKVFKAASLWNPLTAKSIAITPDLLQERLNDIPWMDAELRTALEGEVAPYKAACALVEGPVKVFSAVSSFASLLVCAP